MCSSRGQSHLNCHCRMLPLQYPSEYQRHFLIPPLDIVQQSGQQPDLDIWWRHPHLQNGAYAEKHEGRSLPGSLLRLEVSFLHTTLRAVTLDNEKSGVWRKNAVRWTFLGGKRPNTRVFQLKEMPDKEQNIVKKKVSFIFWTFGKFFFEIYIKFACW